MEKLLNENLGEGNYAIGIDEAAFYGPKLDIQIKNVFGKEDTLITIQIDMLLAKKFGMEYVDSDGQLKRPYIIHRTSLGCYERTLAYLIEKYAGALPTWMAPVQAKFLPMGDGEVEYCQKIADRMTAMGMRVEVDKSNNTIGYKIRAAQTEKVPYMLIVGAKEVEQGTVSVRSRKEGEKGAMSSADFLSMIVDEIAEKRR
jgi:threonyl-tRNA synthetase